MDDRRALVLRGDARALPLPDGSVDLIVTSPPYFALRSYTDGGEHYAGQIGSEATPGEYVDNLIACTREWMRVLKPSGSLWVNLGDKYAGSPSGPRDTLAPKARDIWIQRRSATHGVPQKSLLGLPWRYALRCIDDLGLILRAEVIWNKPNGLPESVTDRVRRSHEQWFHMVQQPRYFSAVDEIRVPYEPDSARRKLLYGDNPGRDGLAGLRATGVAQHGSSGVSAMGVGGSRMNPLGALPSSVWEIPTEPLTVPEHLGVDHFAAFPTEWPRRIVLGWSPSGICTACGEGRRPVVARTRTLEPGRRALGLGSTHAGSRVGPQTGGPSEASSLHHLNTYALTGEACACPDTTAPTRPSVVLDPFGGTGTTALVAKALGRVGITVDRSGDYCRLAQWRTTDRGQLAKAMRVPKPPAVADGQLDIFGAVS